MSVPVEVAIPLDEMPLLPVADEWLNVVEVRVTAMDGRQPLGTFDAIAGTGAADSTTRPICNSEHSYVITVHDPLTGTNLTSTGSELGLVPKLAVATPALPS